MDFREAQYITTIADTGNVTLAAQKLYMSQPALSQILAKVEKELGVKLFRRGKGMLTLTYAGEIYVNAARKILAVHADMRREIADICSGESGEIRVGIPVERSGYLLSPILPTFRGMHPRVKIVTLEAPGVELVEALRKDQVDFIVLPADEKRMEEDLTGEKIYSERLVLVANPALITTDMLENSHQVRLAQVAKLPMICQKPGQTSRRYTDQLMARFHLDPVLAAETGSAISATQLAAAGLGFAIVPERAPNVLRKSENLCCYDFLPAPQTWDIQAIYRKEGYLDHLQRSLIDLMKREAQNYNNSLSRSPA